MTSGCTSGCRGWFIDGLCQDLHLNPSALEEGAARGHLQSLVRILLGDEAKGIASRMHEIQPDSLAWFVQEGPHWRLERAQIAAFVRRAKIATLTAEQVAERLKVVASGPENYLNAMKDTGILTDLIQLTEGYADSGEYINQCIREADGKLELFSEASLAALKILGKSITSLDLRGIYLELGALKKLAEYFPNVTTLD